MRQPQRSAVEAWSARGDGRDAHCNRGRATMSERRRYASVIGPARCQGPLERLAYDVGAGLARAGFTVVTGGEGGAMAAASRGASEAGGLAVGVLPGTDRSSANEHADVTVVTAVGFARNL